MERKEYSAGTVKLSFWFMEFRKAVGLLSSGETYNEIRRRSDDENLFAAPTPARGKKICNTIITRIKSLDVSFIQLFVNSDLSTQKLWNLTAIMTCDTLFFDFVYEVIREKIIIGSNELADKDIRVFFKDKQTQDDKVAKWEDVTINRLESCYKTMLYESGIIDKSVGVRKILKPILDPQFQSWLMDHDMQPVVKALSGVR